ncbi:hypothetical protein BC826DRAFT_989258 [Russula brevipes]|nr:hypothetical protein BC826DRAFT_989258 [Russula brevipes]
MVTGVLVPTESSSGMSTGAQPEPANIMMVCGPTLFPVIRGQSIDQDFELVPGTGADGYSLLRSAAHRTAAQSQPSHRARAQGPFSQSRPLPHSLSPVPQAQAGAGPSHGNWLRSACQQSSSSFRCPSPHPGTGIPDQCSQSLPPILDAASYPYGSQSRGLPSVPVVVPNTDMAWDRYVRYPHSRSPSLLPRAVASPTPDTRRNRSRQSKTLLPDAFSRPANFVQPNTSFETRKIQDMDDFYVPIMPKVLVPRDVNHDEWFRFIQDVTLAWAGTGRLSSQPSVVATSQLIDLWNDSFFTPRGVEIERGLPGFSEDSDSDSLSSGSQCGRGAGVGGSYADSRGMRAERKAERRRKKKERALRREREKTFALYMMCVAVTPRDGAPTKAKKGSGMLRYIAYAGQQAIENASWHIARQSIRCIYIAMIVASMYGWYVTLILAIT